MISIEAPIWIFSITVGFAVAGLINWIVSLINIFSKGKR